MPDDELMEEYRRRKCRYRILVVTILIVDCGLLLAVLGAAVFHSRLTVPLAIAFVAVMLVMVTVFITWTVRYWRCPACNRILPAIVHRTDFCPRCGRRLQ